MKKYNKKKTLGNNSYNENKKICVIITGRLKNLKTNNIIAEEETAYGDNIVDLRENLKD